LKQLSSCTIQQPGRLNVFRIGPLASSKERLHRIASKGRKIPQRLKEATAGLRTPLAAKAEFRRWRQQKYPLRTVTTKFGLLSAAAVLSAGFVTPLMAQAVIDYPAACAQFYPDANCENLGPGNPYTGSYQPSTGSPNNSYAMDDRDSSSCARRYRSYDPASETYLGHDRRRHPCR
jgi:hypothetical protein